MKQQWAEAETDQTLGLLDPMPQFSGPKKASTPTTLTLTERLAAPKGISNLARGRQVSRQSAAPKRHEGGNQSEVDRSPGEDFRVRGRNLVDQPLTVCPIVNGDHAEIKLASTPSTQTATEVLGLQTLAAISSALAHEVSAPLRWVTSFSELLVQEEGASLHDAGKDYLMRISGAAGRLDRVMRDLQKFVTAGIQEPRQQSVALEAAVCAVLGNLSSEISAKNAQVSVVRPLPLVKGDADWVHQCLIRLLENALKFVSPGVAPAVRIRAESHPRSVRVYIEDNGLGIPATQHERIFGLFTRLSHDFPGTGAGLALTRQACERMGGRTGVESEPGKGSRFWIELPEAV